LSWRQVHAADAAARALTALALDEAPGAAVVSARAVFAAYGPAPFLETLGSVAPRLRASGAGALRLIAGDAGSRDALRGSRAVLAAAAATAVAAAAAASAAGTGAPPVWDVVVQEALAAVLRACEL
jgi:hypothetical protein